MSKPTQRQSDEWRRERARLAGKVSGFVRRARAEERADRFDSKRDAYAAGYHQGYQTALRRRPE